MRYGPGASVPDARSKFIALPLGGGKTEKAQILPCRKNPSHFRRYWQVTARAGSAELWAALPEEPLSATRAGHNDLPL